MRFVRLSKIAGAIFAVCAIAGATVVIVSLRGSALSQAEAELEQTGAAAAEQVASIMRTVDVVLQDVSLHIDAAGQGGERLQAEFDEPELAALLSAKVEHAAPLAAISVADEAGRVRSWSRKQAIHGLSVADRDFFRDPAASADVGRLFLSKLQQSRVSQERTVFVSRRLGSDPRLFQGVVFGSVPLDRIEAIFRGLARGSGVAISLRRSDGTEMLLSSDSPDGLVQSPPPGGRRLIAERALPQYDVRLIASVSTRRALAGWRWQAIAIGALTLLAVLCVVGALALLLRRISGQSETQRLLSARNAELEAAHARVARQAAELEQAAVALRENEHLLADRSRLLKVTLEHIDQGIIMVDASRTVVVYNHRALDVLGMPEALLAGAPKFDALLAYQWEHGEFSRTGVELIDFIRAGGISTAAHVYQRERPNGQVVEISSLPLAGGGMVRTYTDITAQRTAQDRIERMALFDDLTELPNRLSLRRALDRALAAPGSLALLSINLDGFRLLNDARGHVAGDAMLLAVSRRLREALLADEWLARTGGDEFALIHPFAGGSDDTAARAAFLLQLLSRPYDIDGNRLTITVSIGTATASAGTTTDMLLRNADIAMYRAKDGGRNQVCRFMPAMMAAQQQRFMMEQALREALGTPALRVVYQPIVSLSTNAIAGFETLLRWTDPARGEIPPSEFIPIAEETGLIVPLGRSALEWACAEAAHWGPDRNVAVNLSPAQFLADDVVATVKQVLQERGLAAERLELEVTEGMLLQDTGPVRETMFALRDLGVSLTLDDFGTGHAGLSYLRRFPFQKFKIDRSFVRNLGRAREADMIVEEMLTLARRLGLRVVAEGVETEAELELLRRLGCDFVQGFLTGRPVSAEVARTLA